MNEELIKKYLADFVDRVESRLKMFERRLDALERSGQHDPTGILRIMPDPSPKVNEHGTPLGPKSSGYGDHPIMEAAIRKEPPRE